MIKEMLKKCSFLYCIWKEIKKGKHCIDRFYGYRNRKNKKIGNLQKIVFIVDYPQGWNSLRTIYESMKNQEKIHTLLIAYTGNEFNDNHSVEFWRKVDQNAIIIENVEQVIKLKDLKADIIFRQTPYDIEYPVEYSAKNICRYSKLCYVTYGYDTSPKKHLEIGYNHKFFPFGYAFFADNNNVYRFLQKKKKESKYYRNINIFNYGFPRFDLVDPPNEKLNYTSYLYIPRWSMDAEYNDASTFFIYMENLIALFSENDKYKLIIRPHPSMFTNFIQNKYMSEREVKEFKEKIGALNNIYLDENKDYMPCFKEADVLIADFSSLIVEFFLSGKPIIYCGDTAEFNQETENIVNTFYKISNWFEIEKIIKRLIECDDPLLEIRLKAIKNFWKNNSQNAGRRIAWACINEI